MKKLFAAIITAFLMSAGLVATSTSTASAADCPYQGCTYTETQAVGLKSRAPRKARIYVNVSSFGNGRPQGVIRFTFVNERTGRSFTATRNFPGGGRNSVFGFRPVPKGKYTVVVNYAPADGTNFQGSSDTANVRVKGGRRR